MPRTPARQPQRKLLLLTALMLMLHASGAALPKTISVREKCTASDFYSPFALQPLTDGLLLGAGVTSSAAGLAMQYLNFPALPDWEDVQGTLHTEDLYITDASWLRPYSKGIDRAADVTCAVSLAVIPLGLFGTEALRQNLPAKELLTIGTMYAESYLISYGIKNILKVAVHRARPYAYTYGQTGGAVDSEGLDNHDFEFSFPSGHATSAFMSAGFVSYVFSQYYPESRLKALVYIASYSCAFTTALLRVSSGNHFLSDVAAGAALGTVVGIGVPFIHSKLSAMQFGKNATVQLRTDGVFATMYF